MSDATAAAAGRTSAHASSFGVRVDGLALAEAVFPEQPVEIDAIDAGRARRRADAVLVLAQQLFQVAAFERADPGLARLAQRLADVDGALGPGNGSGGARAARRGEVMQRHATFEVVAQLADVARPGVLGQRAQEPRRTHGRQRLVVDGSEVAHDVLDQRRQIGEPLAQRRQPHLDDRQPVVEVGAELVGAHLLAQAAVGGGDQPHVHRHVVVGADAPDLAPLQHAQQLGLQVDASARRSRRGTPCRRWPPRTRPGATTRRP